MSFQGDCIEATVATSLFGMYASAIEKFQSFSEGRAFFSPAFILAWLLLKLSYILNMFISREREYRADAMSSAHNTKPAGARRGLAPPFAELAGYWIYWRRP